MRKEEDGKIENENKRGMERLRREREGKEEKGVEKEKKRGMGRLRRKGKAEKR
jgi:hypothetical protein